MLGFSNGVKKKGVMVRDGKYLSTIRALCKEKREEEKSAERRRVFQEDL
jgi:hypothetical protein